MLLAKNSHANAISIFYVEAIMRAHGKMFRAYQINYFVYFKWMHISANKRATFSLMSAKCSLLFSFSTLKIEESKRKNSREIRYITKLTLFISLHDYTETYLFSHYPFRAIAAISNIAGDILDGVSRDRRGGARSGN